MILLDLSGEWTLKRIKTGEKNPCSIPGDNFSALFKAGVITDPFFGENELDLQWVGKEDWSLTTSFSASEEVCSSPNTILELQNIDTVFELLLNDEQIGSGCNAFLGYHFPLIGLLKEGSNKIEIILRSAEHEALKIKSELAYPIPHMSYPVQSEGRNLIRKTQCHSGWDWGPCLMVSGIYGKTTLKASSLEIIESIHTDIIAVDESFEKWIIEISLDLYCRITGSTIIEASCAGVNIQQKINLQPGKQTVKLQLVIENPNLWWPAGYGSQPLYELNVKTSNDSTSRMIGFRKAEVITDADEKGIGMKFRINNKNIFCKGANWIPSDALPSRQNRSRYDELISSAANANMNMLRVWGGGQYEADYFYELCDEKGIMVWQDFMFSCSVYPADESFLENVHKEAEYQIKRLKSHPSIVLWCGNNENVGALTWFEETKENRDRYIIDYDRLNEGIIGKTVKELDKGRKWWSSSPSAGEGDYSDCWHDDSKGDMHYWSVWHEGKPFEAYQEVVPRFCSEFGFQSFPSMKTIKSFADSDQLNVTSPVMEHHQRNDRGNSIIISTISRYFRFPSSFEETIYLSRIQQAMAIKTAVEYWRTKRPVCMGSLYWQLNDTWPVASWSSLEYDGSWKPLHYSAKRFYAPLLLTLHETSDSKLIIQFCNDSFDIVKGSLIVELWNFNGDMKEIVNERIEASAEVVSLLKTIEISSERDFRRSHFYNAKFIPENPDEQPLENSLFLEKPKKCNIHTPEIKVNTDKFKNESEIILTTDKPAFFVVLESPTNKGRFSDNNITLLPGYPKNIKLTEFNQPDSMINNLRIRSLRNNAS